MHEIKMPQLGQSVEEAAIVEWLKQEGDEVKQGEPLFSIQTDKAEIECESTAAGILRKILLEPDVTVPVLTVVALVGDADEPLPDLAQYQGTTQRAADEESATAPVETAPEASEAPAPSPPAAIPSERGVSPRARARAEELDIDLAFVVGTGPNGRVTEEDVLARAEKAAPLKITPVAKVLARERGIDVTTLKGTGAGGKITKEDVAGAKPTAAAPAGDVEHVPLTPMRRIIAKRMAESAFSAPHYYVSVEVDMTAAKKSRTTFANFRPSHNVLIMWAAALALRDFPGVNARWAGDAIEHVGDINLGFAVAVPDGLVVPVIRQVQRMTLEQFDQASKLLLGKARDGGLLPDDYSGNTFTVSNMGVFGVDLFTAIINPPDSAILAIGRIKDKPVVINGGIQIRPMMNMTLSSDHRVIDGAVAAQFLGRVRDILEKAAF